MQAAEQRAKRSQEESGFIWIAQSVVICNVLRILPDREWGKAKCRKRGCDTELKCEMCRGSCFLSQNFSILYSKQNPLPLYFHKARTRAHTHTQRKFLCYLEAIQSHKEPQDVVCTLKDSENSQIPHHSLYSSVLQKQTQIKNMMGSIAFQLHLNKAPKIKSN